MAVLAPIPSVSARRATHVKPRFLASKRKPKRMLRARFVMQPPRYTSESPVGVFRRVEGASGHSPRCEKGVLGESVLGGLTILLELAGEGFGSGKQPRGEERAAHGMLSGGFEADARGPAPSPGTGAGFKDTPVGPHEHPLLDGRDLDHAPAILGVAEGREDLSSDAKVGVVHVGLLGGFGKREREAAKVIGGHRQGPAG